MGISRVKYSRHRCDPCCPGVCERVLRRGLSFGYLWPRIPVRARLGACTAELEGGIDGVQCLNAVASERGHVRFEQNASRSHNLPQANINSRTTLYQQAADNLRSAQFCLSKIKDSERWVAPTHVQRCSLSSPLSASPYTRPKIDMCFNLSCLRCVRESRLRPIMRLVRACGSSFANDIVSVGKS